jgi:hypothetical protein
MIAQSLELNHIVMENVTYQNHTKKNLTRYREAQVFISRPVVIRNNKMSEAPEEQEEEECFAHHAWVLETIIEEIAIEIVKTNPCCDKEVKPNEKEHIEPKVSIKTKK